MRYAAESMMIAPLFIEMGGVVASSAKFPPLGQFLSFFFILEQNGVAFLLAAGHHLCQYFIEPGRGGGWGKLTYCILLSYRERGCYGACANAVWATADAADEDKSSAAPKRQTTIRAVTLPLTVIR